MSLWHSKVREMFTGIALKEIKPKDFLQEYRSLVHELVSCRNRLKNPVNLKLKNGQPLAQSTIKGFENKIDSLKNEIIHYKVIFKLLRVCDFWGKRIELSTEQEVIKSLLVDYVYNESRVRKCREQHREDWKDQAKFWKGLCEFWQKLSDSTDSRCDFWRKRALGEDKEEEPDSQGAECEARQFKVIDGGMKFEEQPSFTNP